MTCNDKIIKQYILDGGTLYRVQCIDTIRDGGTKMVQCSNGSVYYIHMKTNEIHADYPLTTTNKINDYKTNIQDYLLVQIENYIKRLGEDFERQRNLLKKLKNL